MNYRIDVTVTAPINPTEVEDRVVRAVETIFPTADITTERDRVVAEVHTVEEFADRLREQRILDTARSRLHASRRGDTIEFALKKQAAFHGTVNFSVGNPDELGDLTVAITVHEPDVETFIEYLAPPTDEHGAPIEG